MTAIQLRCGWPVRGEYRTLATGQATNTLGDGLSTAILPLYLLAITDSAKQLTMVLVAIAAVGALGGPLGGVLADRYGHRRIAVVSFISSGFATMTMIFQTSLTAIIISAAIAAGFLRSGKVSRNAYIGIRGGSQRVQLRAYLRSVLNVSYSLGAALALVVVLAAEKGFASVFVPDRIDPQLFPYLVGLGIDAATSIAAGCVYLKLRPQAASRPAMRQADSGHQAGPEPRECQAVALGPKTESKPESKPSVVAWKDWRFLQLSSVLALLVSFYELCSVLLVVYIVDAHDGPKWLVPVNVGVFVLLSLVLQMRVAKRVVDIGTAARSARQGGLLASLGLATLAIAPTLPGPGMIAAVFASTIVIVVGDVMASAGRWELEMGLARPEYMGQYQGVSDLCNTATASTLPAMALAVTVAGSAGWIVLLGATSFAALRLPLLAKKAGSRRQVSQPVTSDTT